MQRAKLIRLFLLSAICLLSRPATAGEYVLFYHNDTLGSPVVLTDSAGNVMWRADYEPFGNLATLTETLPNTHQFIGKEVDAETSLHYLGARFYDGSLGRFLSVDPILLRSQKTNVRFPQRLNMYAYGTNNPYRFLDPTGLDIVDPPSVGDVGGEAGGGDEGGGTGGGGDKNKKDKKDPLDHATKELFDEVICGGILLGCPARPDPIIGTPVVPGITGPGNLRDVSSKEADKIARDHGYKDAEDFKADYVGEKASKYKIKEDKGSGEIILTPVQKGGGANKPTGLKR